MNKLIFFVMFSLFANVVSAEVYIVDLKKIINDSKAGQKAKSQIEGKFEKRQKELKSKRDELANMQEDIKKQSSLLSSDALDKKVEVLRQKEKVVARDFQDYQDEFTKENNTKIGKMMEQVLKIIEAIAKEKSYPLILEKNERLVLYASKEVDLSDEVVARLNKIEINF